MWCESVCLLFHKPSLSLIPTPLQLYIISYRAWNFPFYIRNPTSFGVINIRFPFWAKNERIKSHYIKYIRICVFDLFCILFLSLFPVRIDVYDVWIYDVQGKALPLPPILKVSNVSLIILRKLNDCCIFNDLSSAGILSTVCDEEGKEGMILTLHHYLVGWWIAHENKRTSRVDRWPVSLKDSNCRIFLFGAFVMIHISCSHLHVFQSDSHGLESKYCVWCGYVCVCILHANYDIWSKHKSKKILVTQVTLSCLDMMVGW